jgi:preprotein translocase subunit SecA
MFGSFGKKFFGSSNDRELSKLKSMVQKINELEKDMSLLDQDQLIAKTNEFRERIEKGEDLDLLLPETFSVVREASKRTLKQRHFDVQLIGGIVLHHGKIAEMKTGEGKTLVATLPCYLNALSNKGVHVVTVNDYLAKRDAEWMGEIYNFLGLEVGCLTNDIDDNQRRLAYKADITYGTNNEFGFDYLRDNMKFSFDDMVQRPFNYAIVDEVDSILIDEARTPLIISGQAEDSSELYKKVDKYIPQLSSEDFDLDEKQRTCNLTDVGTEKFEGLLKKDGVFEEGTLFDLKNINVLHHINQALRAHKIFKKNTHYMVKNDNILIIDEFTGRAMEGRRFGEGQHQAIEAKENVSIKPENQTLASITFQNYFRMFPKLSGMTGTAVTEEGEFSEIYNLEVIEIPTNVKVERLDKNDEIYKTNQERDDAVLNLIERCAKRKQPVLVGTVSIAKSDVLSNLLTKKNIKHQVLNARYHEQEAKIIGYAGMPSAVTIATNMAGRGTDIQLGGNFEIRKNMEIKETDDQYDRKLEMLHKDILKKREEALAAGGLYVIGTERHESRRIDNQLRGRTGRQGDKGKSKFLLSLQDDLMRIFGSEKLESMLDKLGLQKGEAIVHPWINKAVEKAQSKVEANNFEIRKQLLKFDDVMNDQRKVIFDQRKEIMRSDNINNMITEMRDDVIENIVHQCIPENSFYSDWDSEKLRKDVQSNLGFDIPVQDWVKEDGIVENEIISRIKIQSESFMAQRVARIGSKIFREAEKSLLLQVLDQCWKDHLLYLDQLRQSIGLRAYGQRDPLNEYKKESFILFEEMLSKIRNMIISILSNFEIERNVPDRDIENKSVQKDLNSKDKQDIISSKKVSRNEKCPCGSGKKYKHCCGRI